ncbi:MAG: methyl-accepting chemotaxis protein [Pseudomonadota bacterium]
MNPRQQIWFGLEVVFVAIGFIILCAFLLFVPPMSDWFGEESAPWLLDELNRTILIKWPLMFVAMIVLFIIGVLMAHRLAGPMQGLSNVLSAWMEGDRSARVRFRKYDYLLPMREPLNHFLETEENVVTQAQELARSVIAGNDSTGAKPKAEELLALLKRPDGAE